MKKRPVNLELCTLQFPVTAIASILHRISGVIMVFVTGLIVWFLGKSLSSPEGFMQVVIIVNSFIVKFILWAILILFIYHTISGIRHMLMDFGYLEETLLIGQVTANIIFLLTLVFAMVFAILLGIVVW